MQEPRAAMRRVIKLRVIKITAYMYFSLRQAIESDHGTLARARKEEAIQLREANEDG